MVKSSLVLVHYPFMQARMTAHSEPNQQGLIRYGRRDSHDSRPLKTLRARGGKLRRFERWRRRLRQV